MPQSTLRRWISDGSLPSTLHKGRRFVDVKDVIARRDATPTRRLLALLDKMSNTAV